MNAEEVITGKPPPQSKTSKKRSSAGSGESSKKRRTSKEPAPPQQSQQHYLEIEVQPHENLKAYKAKQDRQAAVLQQPEAAKLTKPEVEEDDDSTVATKLSLDEQDCESSIIDSQLSQVYAMPSGGTSESTGKLKSYWEQSQTTLLQDQQQPISPSSIRSTCKRSRSSVSASSSSSSSAASSRSSSPWPVVVKKKLPPKKRKPASKRTVASRSRVNIFPNEPAKLYQICFSDIDPTTSVYDNTLRLVRERFDAASPVRRIAEFLSRHNYTTKNCQLTQTELRQLGMERDLAYMFQRSHSFFARQNIYYTMRQRDDSNGGDLAVGQSADNDNNEEVLMFDLKNIYDIFRLILPKYFPRLMYLQANVSFAHHYATQKHLHGYSPSDSSVIRLSTVESPR